MLKISFTNAEVSDHGYGLEVNGKSLEDMHNYYLKEVKGNAEICKRKNYSGERKAS